MILGILLVLGLILFLTFYPIKRNEFIFCEDCGAKTPHDTTDYPDERIIFCQKCEKRTSTLFGEDGKEIEIKITRKNKTPDDKSGQLGRPPKNKE